jgi:hypothetical protein
VSPGVAKRTFALAAVALLAALVSLAVSSPRGGHDAKPLPKPVANWYTSLAAPYAPGRSRRRTACGVRLGRDTLGVAHPLLPCGVKIYLSFGGKEVLTQVIDHAAVAPGREFAITRGLADKIGLHGTQRLRWTYAR